ncbi:RNA-binding protein [Candidatus Babeliales bacterium]|nr:RNA-binding protein [Candidatus Babeliales bacterium]
MNIYIGNLAPSVSEDKLRELFEQFGEVTTVKIILDKFTRAPRGFAFVEMSDTSSANEAITELNGTDLDGQSLRINEARPPKPRPRNNNRY